MDITACVVSYFTGAGTTRAVTEHFAAAIEAAGIPAGLVRMSCGLEHKQDLIDDIAQALEQVK